MATFRENVQKYCDTKDCCEHCALDKCCDEASDCNMPMNMVDDELEILKNEVAKLINGLSGLLIETAEDEPRST